MGRRSWGPGLQHDGRTADDTGVALVLAALLVTWMLVMLVVVGLCVSARDGDRDLGY